MAPPERVVRHDGDDTYLVVAADKGTATFSDLANSVALERGFWLGDAFASGGSVGYDHKAMGITARGAWESVTRHFRELDVDVQQRGVHRRRRRRHVRRRLRQRDAAVASTSGWWPRSTTGTCSSTPPRTRRRPSPSASRLFGLQRSSWADYNRSRISAGGGVWPRTAKSIPVSEPMRAALGLADDVDALSARSS